MGTFLSYIFLCRKENDSVQYQDSLRGYIPPIKIFFLSSFYLMISLVLVYLPIQIPKQVFPHSENQHWGQVVFPIPQRGLERFCGCWIWGVFSPPLYFSISVVREKKIKVYR